MEVSNYSFRFSLLGAKVKMYHECGMGVVVEKESHVVCIYGTNENHQDIYCAVPLCHPKYLKGLDYTVRFDNANIATISVGDIRILIDFNIHKCSNNKNMKNYGSEKWGQDVSIEWDSDYSSCFGE